MSPVFKDFLQGVLTKNPKQRLAWPELLHHPFVAEFVKGKRREEILAHLLCHIILDPVKWPKNMSPICQGFLQGVLTKNPKQRLAWPELLHHPFVAEFVIRNFSPLTYLDI